MTKPTHTPRALVAGAAGLIGSALCRYLLDHGIEVIAVDNFSTGSAKNIEALYNHPHFSHYCHDICSPLENITQPLNFIYHLASPASPDDFDALALEILDVNSKGTENLLKLAQAKGAKLLFSSTSEVYGDPLVHPQTESYWGNVNPSGPRSCYDESKRFGEALITHYARLHSVDYVIARIFNTYGPRMRINDGRVVPAFIKAAVQGEPMLLHGGGQQTRSFCHVDDLVRGLAHLMHSEKTTGETFNIGNPQEFTMEVLATTLWEIVDKPVKLKAVPSPREDDPVRRRPDISKIKDLLGWEPEIYLRDGLLQTVKDFEERLK